MSATHYGKGSSVRPSQVSKEQFANNWDNIFKKKEKYPETFKCILFLDMLDGTGFYIECNNLVDFVTKHIIATKIEDNLFVFNTEKLLDTLNATIEYNSNFKKYMIFHKDSNHHLARIKQNDNDNVGYIQLCEIALLRNLYNLNVTIKESYKC